MTSEHDNSTGTMMPNIDKIPECDILPDDAETLIPLGISFAGRGIGLSRQDMLRHVLVAGSTGSGKTELLLTMCESALAAGSGLLMVDGKGDIGTCAKLYALAASYGRADDVLFVNFANPASPGKHDTAFRSHSMRLFDHLSADAIVELFATTMYDEIKPLSISEGIWTRRAVYMVKAIVEVAVWKRDTRNGRLSVSELRDLFRLPSIIEHARRENYPDMPESLRSMMVAYLCSLPNYPSEKWDSPSPTMREHHGYMEMYVNRLFSLLADSYGHIFDAETSQVDMRDVVLNRRIVIINLPALQKSPEEVTILGRIVVALLKNTMAGLMSQTIEGNWEDVVQNRPTNATYPFLVIMDEVSHCLADGMATMTAQARSLGFSFVFSLQDISGMSNVSKQELDAIIANTNVKIFMAMQNPDQSQYMELLPSGQRDVERDDAIALLEAKIDYARNVEGDHEKASVLRGQVVAIRSAKPAWSLQSTMKMLMPGEFVVVQRGQFVRGRANRPSQGNRESSLAPFRPVDWQFDAVEATRFLGQDGRRREFFDSIRSAGDAKSLSDVLGHQPSSISVVYERYKTESAKASIQLALAMVHGFSNVVDRADGSEQNDFITL